MKISVSIEIHPLLSNTIYYFIFVFNNFAFVTNLNQLQEQLEILIKYKIILKCNPLQFMFYTII